MTLFSFARKFACGAFCTAAVTMTASASPIVNVKLVNPGSPAQVASSVTINGVTKSNVYIGPYTVSVNGVNMSAMCVDFNIESNVGDTYTAYQTNVGSSDLSNTYSPSYGQVYEEEAYLFKQITQTGADRLSIQEAAWNIMAYGITNMSYQNTITNSNSTINGYINSALANYGGMNNVGYAVLSDTSKGYEQEFIVDPPVTAVTPEPSSLVLMLAPGLLGGAEALRRRKLMA